MTTELSKLSVLRNEKYRNMLNVPIFFVTLQRLSSRLRRRVSVGKGCFEVRNRRMDEVRTRLLWRTEAKSLVR